MIRNRPQQMNQPILFIFLRYLYLQSVQDQFEVFPVNYPKQTLLNQNLLQLIYVSNELNVFVRIL